ncbi:MAG: PfkB family carbohydrate kinase [Cyanobacteria bacterium P01_F01_bin.86]
MTESVICLGEYLVDRLFEVGANRTDLAKTWTDHPDDAPANVAAALAKLGISTRLISCLGQETLGDWLIQVLQKQGVTCPNEVDAFLKSQQVSNKTSRDRSVTTLAT